MTRTDFVETVKQSMFMALGSTQEIMGEMITIYLFLQKKGLAEECQNDTEIRNEAVAIMKEGQVDMMKEFQKIMEEAEKISGG